MPALTISSQLRIMGVVNTTPDSFSDGGRFATLDAALAHARELIGEGADILDIGGESSRPGAAEIDAATEIERTAPLITAIRDFSDIPISIDTSKPEVMRAAVAAGAGMINSIWALRHDGALAAAAELDVAVCLMHMQGTPATMQREPRYGDVVAEVKAFLAERIDAALAAGIRREHLVIDPGFGFGKTIEHNLRLLAALAEFRQFGVPLLAGLSRKQMIGTILDKPVDQRLYGSLSAAVIAALLGADILRVHDVAATVDAIKLVRALGEVVA